MRTKTDHQKRVEELMVKASQDIPDWPTMPDEKTRKLRAKLIFEEALETIKALGVKIFSEHDFSHALDHIDDFNMVIGQDMKPDLEGIADGCADISVVTIGTLSACGMADDSLLKEVDENNLLKFMHFCPKCGDNRSVARSTASGKPSPGMRECRCGKVFISGHHNEHGKWVKPVNHPSPDIADVLQKQTDDVEADEAARAF